MATPRPTRNILGLPEGAAPNSAHGLRESTGGNLAFDGPARDRNSGENLGPTPEETGHVLDFCGGGRRGRITLLRSVTRGGLGSLKPGPFVFCSSCHRLGPNSLWSDGLLTQCPDNGIEVEH